MCTLTYLPNNEGKNYIFTSNRDEFIGRLDAFAPQMYEISGKKIFCPVDAQAQGTWIGVNENQTFVCLLNGAFEAHIRQQNYRKSRGAIVKEILLYEGDIWEYLENYDFLDIEPFTLVVREINNFFEMRWDGKDKFFEMLNPLLPHIWSSATLYHQQKRDIRQFWFYEWLLKQENNYTKENILKLQFDNEKGEIDTNFNVNILKYQVKTVSITSIEKINETFEIDYFDLKNKTSETNSWRV